MAGPAQGGGPVTEVFAPRSRKVKILATLGPASSDPAMIRKLDAGRRRRVPDQHEPRRPYAKSEAGRDHPRARKGIQAADDDHVRPAGPQASRRPVQGRIGAAQNRRPLHPRPQARRSAARIGSSFPHPELFGTIRPGNRILIDDGKVRLKGHRGRRPDDRHQGRGRRQGLRQQGRQRPRCAWCRSRR